MVTRAAFRVVLALAVVSVIVAAANAVTIETVPVGNPGNAGELSGAGAGGSGPNRICGAVSYTYNIGKYEVTAREYTEFLNAKATVGDTFGLYNTKMWSETYGCKIQRSGSGTGSDPYAYSVATEYAGRPVNFVSFWDAARFTNWLNNGNTEMGAYTLNNYNGADGRNISRNAGATWFLPSEDEWYKAAYYDPNSGAYYDYPTGSSSAPGQDMDDASGNNANYYTAPYAYPIDPPYYTTLVGEFQLSDSPYGTFDQGGNVWEWNEAVMEGLETNSARGLRGGSFVNESPRLRAAYREFCGNPTSEDRLFGFRVASIPEPGSIALLLSGAVAALIWWKRRK